MVIHHAVIPTGTSALKGSRHSSICFRDRALIDQLPHPKAHRRKVPSAPLSHGGAPLMAVAVLPEFMIDFPSCTRS
jgi:hypothetical protein